MPEAQPGREACEHSHCSKFAQKRISVLSMARSQTEVDGSHCYSNDIGSEYYKHDQDILPTTAPREQKSIPFRSVADDAPPSPNRSTSEASEDGNLERLKEDEEVPIADDSGDEEAEENDEVTSSAAEKEGNDEEARQAADDDEDEVFYSDEEDYDDGYDDDGGYEDLDDGDKDFYNP